MSAQQAYENHAASSSLLLQNTFGVDRAHIRTYAMNRRCGVRHKYSSLSTFAWFYTHNGCFFFCVCYQLPVQRSEFDMSRLQLLNANADKSVLSTDEAKAVASHLMANVPQVMWCTVMGLLEMWIVNGYVLEGRAW